MGRFSALQLWLESLVFASVNIFSFATSEAFSFGVCSEPGFRVRAVRLEPSRRAWGVTLPPVPAQASLSFPVRERDRLAGSRAQPRPAARGLAFVSPRTGAGPGRSRLPGPIPEMRPGAPAGLARTVAERRRGRPPAQRRRRPGGSPARRRAGRGGAGAWPRAGAG